MVYNDNMWLLVDPDIFTILEKHELIPILLIIEMYMGKSHIEYVAEDKLSILQWNMSAAINRLGLQCLIHNIQLCLVWKLKYINIIGYKSRHHYFTKFNLGYYQI